MAEEQAPQLNHYGVYSFTDAYWQQSRADRKKFLENLSGEIPQLAEKVYLYTQFPARPESDLILWSADLVTDDNKPADFFVRYATVSSKWRKYLKPTNTLWGFTRPSMYARGKSGQELDPFKDNRRPYLVVYPFVKTSEWYLKSREERQGMMNEHIKIGRTYAEITQLLLYSTGLQDQEFVVVYETDKLPMFSQLVSDLRATLGRAYTLRDTPIYTATWRTVSELLPCWEG